MNIKSMCDFDKGLSTSAEIERTRKLGSHLKLAPFSRNPTTWELILIVSRFPNLQISELIDRIETRQLSHSTIVRFIQEQISAGNFITSAATKRSAKFLSLSTDIEQALQAFLQETYHAEPETSHSSLPSIKSLYRNTLCSALVMSASLKVWKTLDVITPHII